MLELEAAQQQVLAAIPAAATESVPLAASHERLLAERAVASIDLPVFDNSAMDGYAVRAEDIRGASAQRPITLRLVGRIAAGESFSGGVKSGQCVRLFTGSPLPSGAD